MFIDCVCCYVFITEASASGSVHEEGALSRKHEWEAHNKKATNR